MSRRPAIDLEEVLTAVPWLKSGDNAATHPSVMRIDTVRGADDRLLNEVFGFTLRCALQSAGHMTDYIVDAGTARMLGGARWQDLVRAAKTAGLLTEHKAPGGAKAWRLIEDPEFLHIRLREAVENDRQRDRDRNNRSLIMPVMARDGDTCRYCALTVNVAGGRTSGRTRTFDHRQPGMPATIETYVVSCTACNSARGEDPDADARFPLLPAPTEPYYSPQTAKRLEAYYGRQFQTARPTPTPDTAPTARPGPSTDTAHQAKATPTAEQPRSNRLGEGGTRVGSGEGWAGSGRAGPGWAGSGASPPAAAREINQQRRKRARRGRGAQ